MGGAGWTPITPVRITSDANMVNGRIYAGIQITTNGTASTTYVRHGTTVAAAILFTYTVEAVTGGTTRLYQMPGLVTMNDGIFVDMDASVTEAVVLIG